jgi:hypothetical protein
MSGHFRSLFQFFCAFVTCLLMSACSTNSHLPQDRASRLAGLGLSNFGGADGDDLALQELASELCELREYDFSPRGFQISATPAAMTMPSKASNRFGGGQGPLEIIQPDSKDNSNTLARVSYSIVSNDPSVTNVSLSATFSREQAQHAINTPGVRFAVNWRIGFTLDGTAHSLTADQVLFGIGFREAER